MLSASVVTHLIVVDARSSASILGLNNNNNNSSLHNNNHHHLGSKPGKSALLQQSKSSGNIVHTLQQQRQAAGNAGNALQQVGGLALMLVGPTLRLLTLSQATAIPCPQSHRVHFRFDVDGNAPDLASARGLAQGVAAFPLDGYASGGASSGASGRSKHRDHAPGDDHHMVRVGGNGNGSCQKVGNNPS